MAFMGKPLESVLSSLTTTRKASARVALVDIHEPVRSLLADCFRHFRIESVPMTHNAADRLKREKFEACVINLASEAEKVMEAARSSPSNSRMVIYGLGGTAQDAMRYSRLGINAMFNEPVERPTAMKLVRATQMLVVHEFRRYVRVPVITEVSITSADGRRFAASSKEISSGGMSLKSNEDVAVGAQVEVSFALLTLPRTWVRGVVSWRGKSVFGVRFDPNDDRRLQIKNWVEAYLET
jgi:hypothetical protein